MAAAAQPTSGPPLGRTPSRSLMCKCGVVLSAFDSKTIHTWCDVRSRRFELIVAFVIVLNAICIGLETEFGEEHFTVFEDVVTVFFVLEMCMKIWQLGFLGYARNWRNLFDATLVGLAVGDMWMQLGVASTAQGDNRIIALRVLRLFRCLRLIRLFTIFKQLEVIMDAFFKAFTPVFWVSLLVIIFDYVCAVFLTQIVGHHAATWGDKEEQVYNWFGTVGNSMRTLMIIMTLAEWDGIVLVISEHMNGVIVFLFAVSYIFITAYTMLCIITGSISESLITAQRQDEAHMLEEVDNEHQAQAERVRELLSRLDVDGSGWISSAELKEAYNQPGNNVDAMLVALDAKMDFKDLTQLVELLESMGDGESDEPPEVAIDVVADALASVSGSAKAHAVMAAKHLFVQKEQDAKERFNELEAQIEKAKAKADSVDRKLNGLLARFDVDVPASDPTSPTMSPTNAGGNKLVKNASVLSQTKHHRRRLYKPSRTFNNRTEEASEMVKRHVPLTAQMVVPWARSHSGDHTL